jgi:hypothetical protein
MGTTSPFNAIPYGGGHIPPPSPSLGGAFQQSIGLNTNSSLFSGGSHGPQSYMTLVGSMPFSLFGAFGNNAFSSSSFSVGGNPIFGQPNPMQGFIPSQGVMTGVYSSQGLGNPWQGSFPLQGMSIGETPPTLSGTLGRVQYLCQEGRLGASPTKVLGILCREKSLHKACHPTMRINR